MATPITKPRAPEPVARTNRMTLDAVRRGRIEMPLRVLMHGVEGVGKTTFASHAPRPIFLGAEDGTSHLDVERFPTPETWADVTDAVQTLTAEQHPYKTLVVDTVDWAEPLIWDFICRRDTQDNIEAYGYGKGYTAALDEWRKLLAALERLRAARHTHVVMLAHSWIRPFKNPEGEDYDRYELKLNAKAGGLLKEWSDCVLFANFETYAAKDKQTKRVKGVSTGARLLYTTRTAAYDAKNRHDLPDSMPLDWAEFDASARAHRPAAPEALVAAINAGIEQLDENSRVKFRAALGRASNDPVKLAQLVNIVNAKVAALAAEGGA